MKFSHSATQQSRFDLGASSQQSSEGAASSTLTSNHTEGNKLSVNTDSTGTGSKESAARTQAPPAMPSNSFMRKFNLKKNHSMDRYPEFVNYFSAVKSRIESATDSNEISVLLQQTMRSIGEHNPKNSPNEDSVIHTDEVINSLHKQVRNTISDSHENSNIISGSRLLTGVNSLGKQLSNLFLENFPRLSPSEQEANLIIFAKALPKSIDGLYVDRDAQRRGLDHFQQCINLMRQNGNHNGAAKVLGHFINSVPELSKNDHFAFNNPTQHIAGIVLPLVGAGVASVASAGVVVPAIAVTCITSLTFTFANHQRKNKNHGLGMLGDQLAKTKENWGSLDGATKAELKNSMSRMFDTFELQVEEQGKPSKRLNQFRELIKKQDLDPEDFDLSKTKKMEEKNVSPTFEPFDPSPKYEANGPEYVETSVESPAYNATSFVSAEPHTNSNARGVHLQGEITTSAPAVPPRPDVILQQRRTRQTSTSRSPAELRGMQADHERILNRIAEVNALPLQSRSLENHSSRRAQANEPSGEEIALPEP